MTLEVVKDLLGLIGSILAIVPFLRDFAQRKKIRRWKDYSRYIPVFRKRSETIATKEEAKLREPSSADILFVTVGISLLIASFAVSLYLSMHHTP